MDEDTIKETQDQMAVLFEKWFSNACVNDAFNVEFGRDAPCKGEHPEDRQAEVSLAQVQNPFSE